MHGYALFALPHLALLVACTATPSEDSSLRGTQVQLAGANLITLPQPCGISASRSWDAEGNFTGVRDGEAIRPCEPMGAEAIAHACEVEAGELVYDPEHPSDDRYAEFKGPELEVSGAVCRDQNAEGSEVLCDFTITYEGARQHVSGHAFRHVYAELHDEISHSYMTYWSTRSSCLAAPSG